MSVSVEPIDQVKTNGWIEHDISELPKPMNRIDRLNGQTFNFRPEVNRYVNKSTPEDLLKDFKEKGFADFNALHLKQFILNYPHFSPDLKSNVESAYTNKEILDLLSHSSEMLSFQIQIK
jgi:hypothetical protein